MTVASLMSSVSPRLEVNSRWGLWPFAIVLALLAAARLGAIVFHPAPPRHRALFGAVAALAAIVVGVRVIGALGGLSQDALFIVLLTVTGALFLARRDRALGVSWPALLTRETAPLAVVAGGALGLAAIAAHWLPVWQWDALGYHLPYVNFALQRGTLFDVPSDVPYISTYPHAIEHYFIAWRAMLSDDRLVDAAQIPLGLLGAGAVACLARELGARVEHAVSAGLLWLTLPAVFLQLPTNYVDVGCAALLLSAAAFTLAEPSARNVLAAGIALGLFLGSKPNAPVGTALMLMALGWRAWRARLVWPLVASVAVVLILGSESYVANFVGHGNPVWPVKVSLGPIELPGKLPMQELLDSGPGAPRLHGSLPLRLLRSWTSLDAPPAFDMRYGGLGLVFLLTLPVALVVGYRRRDPVLGLVALATLASPDPSFARYILPFPGLVLALAVVPLSSAPTILRRFAVSATALAAAVGLFRAYPGLTGEGPPLTEYARMTESERLRAVGANGTPAGFYDALERLGPEDSTAFDESLELPYLAWLPDLSRTAARIPDDVARDEAERIVGDPRVRLLIVDRASIVAEVARARGDTFTELFHCKSSACVVLLRT